MPPARAKALETAFLAAHKDPRYLADAKTLKVDVSPIGGDAARQAIARLAVTPPALRDALRKLLAKKQ